MVIAVFKGWDVVRCNGLLQTQNMAFPRVKKNTNSAPHSLVSWSHCYANESLLGL